MLRVVLLISTTLLGSACGNNTVQTPDTIDARLETAAQATEATPGALCLGAGPQTPRDISSKTGLNNEQFSIAPAATEMNLCNLHLHAAAEHKGPGFSVVVSSGESRGFACNDGSTLTAEQRRDPTDGTGAFKGVKPGDTVEVHWVYSTCDGAPGAGLAACTPAQCQAPVLRVEAQTFLVVNDPSALDFRAFDYRGAPDRNGKHQPRAVPSGTGEPVVFRGSTTGPSYTESSCSPARVTWSVRPQCARIDISSLHAWAANGNAFDEHEAHGVRELVTAPELLAPIE
jgi:hypothetical protein